MELKEPIVGGGNARDAAEASQEHAEEVRATHMGVDHVDSACLAGRRDPPQLIHRPAPQVGEDNIDAVGFYEAAGYVRDDVVEVGKRLVRDDA